MGSYPPVPVPAAAVAMEVVRKALDADEPVTVVSPRASAAHYAVRVAGPLAGRRLDRMRRLSGASRLTMVMEAHLPLPVGEGAVGNSQRRATVVALRRSFRRFDSVRLMVVGDLGVPDSEWEGLLSAASVVERVSAPALAPGGVTSIGPADMLVRDKVRRAGGRVTRRLLGSDRSEALRQALAKAWHARPGRQPTQ
ncbi:MAG: hypothetical protein ACRDYC_08925 [Acidimicrobiales bacterium]